MTKKLNLRISIIVGVITSIAYLVLMPNVLSVYTHPITSEGWENLKDRALIATTNIQSSDDIEVSTNINKDNLIIVVTDYPYELTTTFPLRECKKIYENDVIRYECKVDPNNATYVKNNYMPPFIMAFIILLIGSLVGYLTYIIIDSFFL